MTNSSQLDQNFKLYWDYYGPASKRTADHFHHHLIEWLQRAELARDPESFPDSFWPCETGVIEYERGHSAAYCILPMLNGERVTLVLKAHRSSQELLTST